MKIGILTFHRTFNYGAVLQTLGLVVAIQKEYPGATVEVIDYYNKRVQTLCRSFYMAPGNKVVSFAKAVIRYPERLRKKKNYDEFVEKYIPLSAKSYYEQEELNEVLNEYDFFITGSDQVWNSVCGNFDKAYFLTFVKDVKKKISYAASFGFKEMPENLTDEYRRRLEAFDKISVRENSGSRILLELNGKDSKVCLDPTLLLDKNTWEKYVVKNTQKEPYIFVYSVMDPAFKEKLEEIAEKTNRKVIYLNDAWKVSTKRVKYIRGISPIEFISYIYHADMVLTNSFHGTVFSIIFEKLFFVETKNGKYENDRIINLLEITGIQNKEIKNQDWECVNRAGVNWEKVKKNLAMKQESSLEFLRESLK